MTVTVAVTSTCMQISFNVLIKVRIYNYTKDVLVSTINSPVPVQFTLMALRLASMLGIVNVDISGVEL